MHLKKNRSPEDLESCVQKLSTPQLWMNMKDGLDGQQYVVIVYLDGTFEGENQEDEVENWWDKARWFEGMRAAAMAWCWQGLPRGRGSVSKDGICLRPHIKPGFHLVGSGGSHHNTCFLDLKKF